MPHEVVYDAADRSRGDSIQIADAGGGQLLRLHQRPGGDAVVVVATEARRDGRPLLGNLACIAWGTSALLRIGRTRVEIRWRGAHAHRAAEAGARCRVCFGSFATDDVAIACVCAVVMHDDCDRAMQTCPGCGAPREGRAE